MDYINSLSVSRTKNFIAGVMKSRFISSHKKLELASMATAHLNELLTRGLK